MSGVTTRSGSERKAAIAAQARIGANVADLNAGSDAGTDGGDRDGGNESASDAPHRTASGAWAHMPWPKREREPSPAHPPPPPPQPLVAGASTVPPDVVQALERRQSSLEMEMRAGFAGLSIELRALAEANRSPVVVAADNAARAATELSAAEAKAEAAKAAAKVAAQRRLNMLK